MYPNKVPKHVQFDLSTFFERPGLSSAIRLGLVTKMECNGDFLYVKGCISDDSDHDKLAHKAGLSEGEIIKLPPEMYSDKAGVVGWNISVVDGGFGLIAGQIKDTERTESVLGYEQTDRCLKMAALALGCLLKNTPREIIELSNQPGDLIFKLRRLARLRREIGNSIFG